MKYLIDPESNGCLKKLKLLKVGKGCLKLSFFLWFTHWCNRLCETDWLGVKNVLQKLTKSYKNEVRHLFQCCILIPKKYPRKTPFQPPTPTPNEAIASCWEPWSSATKSRWRSLEKIHLIKLPQRASLGIFALNQTFSLFPTVSSYFLGFFFQFGFQGALPLLMDHRYVLRQNNFWLFLSHPEYNRWSTP